MSKGEGAVPCGYPRVAPVELLLWVDRTLSLHKAEALAERLSLPLVRERPANPRPVLFRDAEGLALGWSDMPARHMLRADFSRLLPRLRPQFLQGELLLRAARIRRRTADLRAVDATAGLGEDALLLAAAGFAVLLFERNPIIAALLEDGLRRAERQPALAGICARMQCCPGDSVELLQGLEQQPDVVLLDPMFPLRRKRAEIKKKFQLLQLVERPCVDEAALLQAALAACPRKVVIKRPLQGPPLAGITPSYSLKGKAIRFDCLQVRV